MKKRFFQSLLILFCICSLFKINILAKEDTKRAEEISAITFDKNHFYNIYVSAEEPIFVSSQEPSDDTLDELNVLSEALIFPDAYFNPETEEYNEEEFWDDCELLALVCVAEAKGESELGKRLVIDTVLNRVDSSYFPGTIREVVYAPGQFGCVSNGSIDKVEYDEYIAKLVLEEFNNRTNNEVLYFRTGGYFRFGKSVIKEGNHYFSKRK